MTSAPDPATLHHRITSLQAGLPPQTRLIAVTKTYPAAVMRLAYGAGVRHFGESRIQEALPKQEALADLPDITWHFIGQLQSNKARKAVEHFDWIHSVSSLKLAQKLDQAAADLQRQPCCCLQVKLIPDPPKAGFSPEELAEALPTLDALPHLRILGLMTIPPQGTPATEGAALFQQAAALATSLNQQGFQRLRFQELSMGMSGDYGAAIAAGATWIRVGSYLFGDRH